MKKLIESSTGAMRRLPWWLALATSMSWSACSTRVRVIPADQQLDRLPAGQTFTAPVDGWFLGDALYQRYRQAVADRILEMQTAKGMTHSK